MLENIYEIIAGELGVDIQNITEDTDIIENLGANSLNVVNLIMMFEDAYGITVADEDVIELRTPHQIAEYIEKNS